MGDRPYYRGVWLVSDRLSETPVKFLVAFAGPKTPVDLFLIGGPDCEAIPTPSCDPFLTLFYPQPSKTQSGSLFRCDRFPRRLLYGVAVETGLNRIVSVPQCGQVIVWPTPCAGNSIEPSQLLHPFDINVSHFGLSACRNGRRHLFHGRIKLRADPRSRSLEHFSDA